jgi:hypothetical protein
MRSRAAALTLRAVTTTSRRTLTLELEDEHADSIVGRLSNEAGEAIEFVGWLGLAGALDEALEGAPADRPSDLDSKEGRGAS